MKRGDVVIIDFPYSDRTGSKVRPSLVVQSDTLNPIRDDAILAIITSMSSGRPHTEILIEGRGVLGFYARHENALDAGYDRLGGGPFLVKQVLSKCRGDSAAAAGPNATITTIRAGRS